MASLKRYVRHFQLNVKPNATKAELVQACVKHFAVKPKLREAEVLSQFLYATRRQGMKSGLVCKPCLDAKQSALGIAV